MKAIVYPDNGSPDVLQLIDRYYPLNEVAKAIQYLEEAHAREKVSISVEQKYDK